MSEDTHWLLPINPAAHPEHMPADWRTRPDATAVWEAIGRSQPVDRWCLRTGFRTMRAGDVIWAYLSQRQELCAVGRVRRTAQESGVGVSGVRENGADAGRVGDAAASPSGPRASVGVMDGVADDGDWYVYVDWDERRTAELCRRPIPRSLFGQAPMSVRRLRDVPAAMRRAAP